jgi:presenilin-like A22 family membrane protease
MQVEEVRNPSLHGRSLAVTQKYLVVTANYEARAAGVTKLMGLQDALKACPHLVTVSARFYAFMPQQQQQQRQVVLYGVMCACGMAMLVWVSCVCAACSLRLRDALKACLHLVRVSTHTGQ